jgi:CheY-like chemotaxis protein
VHQVLLNLCVNARDAMPHGGTLTVEAECIEVDATYASSIPDAKPGRYIVLRVRDTGTGISPEILDRIFDPFFTTKAPDKGTGLGLSTVMGIVKGHGGFLQVYSQPGQGSNFSVYFPVDTADGSPEPPAKAATDFKGNDELILFVDDEAPLRDIARAVLRRLNFRAVTATDGVDGLIQAAEHRSELRAIITDLHMPQLDGLGFVRGVRRILPDIPIVVISGRMEEAVALELESFGVTERLDKPFTQVQLAAALKNLFQQKS